MQMKCAQETNNKLCGKKITGLRNRLRTEELTTTHPKNPESPGIDCIGTEFLYGESMDWGGLKMVTLNKKTRPPGEGFLSHVFDNKHDGMARKIRGFMGWEVKMRGINMYR